MLSQVRQYCGRRRFRGIPEGRIHVNVQRVNRKQRMLLLAATVMGAGVVTILAAARSAHSATQNHTSPSQSATQASVANALTSSESNPEEPAMTQPAKSSSNTSVTINGESVPVPANGVYSSTTTSSSDRTEVTVNSTHSTSSDGGTSDPNYSSVNINISNKTHTQSSSSD